eukprot:2484894-Rhodomonas_salina.1
MLSQHFREHDDSPEPSSVLGGTISTIAKLAAKCCGSILAAEGPGPYCPSNAATMSSSAQGSACGGRGSGAEEAGACVLGWRLGGRRIRHQVAPTAAPAPPRVGLRASDLSWGAKKAGACVPGWRGRRLGTRRIRHQVAPKAVPAPQHFACGVKGHRESAEAGGVCVSTSVLEPPGLEAWWQEKQAPGSPNRECEGGLISGALGGCRGGWGMCAGVEASGTRWEQRGFEGIGGVLRRLGPLRECRGGGLVSGGAGTR